MSWGPVRPLAKSLKFHLPDQSGAGAGRWVLEDEQPIADVALPLFFRASPIAPLRSCEDLDLQSHYYVCARIAGACQLIAASATKGLCGIRITPGAAAPQRQVARPALNGI